jgi:hypothetical protein
MDFYVQVAAKDAPTLGLTAVANLLFSISHSLKSLTKKNHSYV